MDASATTWKTVLEYSPMSNGRAGRMVGTLKAAVKKLVLASVGQWDTCLSKSVFGYRCRKMSGGSSPLELMYGTTPRVIKIVDSDITSQVGAMSDDSWFVVLLSVERSRAERSTGFRKPVKETQLNLGEKVLVARDEAVARFKKWSSLVSKFYGPFQVV